MNPIKYSELILNDTNGFDDLVKQLAAIKRNYDGLSKSVTDNAARLAEGLKALNPATPEGQAQLAAYALKVEELTKKVKTLEDALKNYKQTQKEIAALDAESIRRKIEHKEKVKELTDKVKEYVAEQRLSESTLDQLSRKEEVQKMSYNQLSQAYTLLTNKINEMTAATETEIQAREKLSAIARGVYEQMNTRQQAIGKYTLQVGNYAKSWNGLNIAMQQIVREVPNMAMGFNTFFLAISNNIPILSDQIKLAQDKYKADEEQIKKLMLLGDREKEIAEIREGMVPVGKQILTSLLSWQTIMMAGVTILTMFGGKMIEHISNWIKARKGIDGAAQAMKAYTDVLADTSSSAAEATAKLNTLYRVATDLNASMEDRLGAIKDLKALYPDIFDGLETEAILAGNAKDQYDLLSTSIYKAAQAEAAFSKLAEIAGEEMEHRMRQQERNRQAILDGYLGVNDMAQFYGSYIDENADSNPIRKATLSKEQRKMVEAYQESEKVLDELRVKREAIQKMMEDYDLFGFLNGNKAIGSGAGKQESVEDLYWQAMESMISGLNAGLQRELAILEVNYSKQQESFKEKEAELLKLMQNADSEIAAEAEIQLKNLQVLVASAENNYQSERNKLFQDMLDSYAEDVADEGKIEEQEKKVFEAKIKVDRELAKAEAYTLFNESRLTQEELNDELTRINNNYWRKYAEKLKSMGDMEGFNEAMSHVKGEDDEKENPIQKWIKKWIGDKKFIKSLEKAAKLTIGYIGDIIDAYHELAEAAVEAAEKQVDAAQKVYEAELGAYQNGYANQVEFARKELALRKQQLAEAAEQEKRYAKMQKATESAEQAVTLASTIAYLFRDASKFGGILGVPLAIAASTAMLAAFTASKITAAKVANQTVEYGDGMHEYLDYGGSHASGNDIDFGTMKDGRKRRVERGEMVAVFNKRNTDKYGASVLGNLVDSINHGTFERDYLGVFASGADGNGVIVMNNFPSSVSDDISAIRKSTESQRYVTGNGTIIEKYRNRTRIIHVN